MKYFIDTEFIEGFHKPLFSKRRHFIDLISIGIVAEDGRTFYAISNEYNYNDADDWVKKNVIIPMYIDTVHGDARNRYDASNFHKFYGLENKQIYSGIIKFCSYPDLNLLNDFGGKKLEFYGYYADYDWVLFCSLFGRMIDLPKGFPMYCRDLKQMLDEKATSILPMNHSAQAMREVPHEKYVTFEQALKHLKSLPTYPKQENEHNALADAKWNYELFKFLNS